MSPIVGVGIDVVELDRLADSLERHGRRFVERICRESELDPGSKVHPETLGGLFAAKEAVLKALGTGWAQGLGFRQVEIRKSSGGQPTVVLHERAAERAGALNIESIHVSITHERKYAAAVAVAEAKSEEAPNG